MLYILSILYKYHCILCYMIYCICYVWNIFLYSTLYSLHNFSVPRHVRDALSTIHSYIHQLILNTTFTTNSSLLNSIPDYHLTFHTLSYPFLPFYSLGLDNYSPLMLLLLRLLQTFISLFVSILSCYQTPTILYTIYCTWDTYISLSISPDNVCITSPLSAFQILTVLSQDPDTTLLPSTEKPTEVTRPAWPDKRYMSNKNHIANACYLLILTDMIKLLLFIIYLLSFAISCTTSCQYYDWQTYILRYYIYIFTLLSYITLLYIIMIFTITYYINTSYI